MTTQSQLFRAAELIRAADAMLITAGAGIGVDSGLPDFRGGSGFWGAYPALGKAGLDFRAIASPTAFERTPHLAWGFYGHRLQLYRKTIPHAGFRVLLDIAESLPHGAFIYTSNVDGQFQKAGFRDVDICEYHGSIHHLQCMEGCADEIWSAHGFDPVVDEDDCVLVIKLPTCPHCGGLARPNIVMFRDWGWLDGRTNKQSRSMKKWMEKPESLVVVEIGAGTAIPKARMRGEATKAPLIRINIGEAEVGRAQDVSLAMGALEALTAIASLLPS